LIDHALRADSHAEALARCAAAAGAPARLRPAIAYREALCLEALGRLKEAGEAFRRAEPGHGSRALWAVAVLGQARCAAAAGDLTAAQGHLDRVALSTGHPGCAGTNVAAECLVMRARLAAVRAGAGRATDPFAPEALAWPPFGARAAKYMDYLPPDAPEEASDGPAAPNVLQVHPVPRRPGEFETTAHLAERPAAAVVRELAAAAGLQLEMSAPVAAALGKGAVVVDVEEVPLGEVLDALVTGPGFGWKIAGDRLTVAPGAPVPDRAAAIRALRRLQELVPDHPAERVVRVWLANFQFAAGARREAAQAFQKLVEDASADAVGAPELPYAAYNLGLAELSAGTLPSARSRFVDLMDRAPHSRWADYAWWWIGRTHLDVGDFPAARGAFRRALAGKTGEVAAAAVLGTCTLELLDGTDGAARAALDGRRPDARPQYAALRAALEAVLRYRTGPTAGRRAALLEALAAAGDAGALGAGGTYFAGRVYRDLGLSERTVALFDAASLTTRGPLARRMSFEAAQWYDALGRADAARQRYLAIAATDPNGLGPKAELGLAELALREKKADECVRRCRRLLARDGVERAAVLAAMGRGYELQKNFRAAADCFAGRVPAEPEN
jgi:tetratricopeptide (TPR) repeat protein